LGNTKSVDILLSNPETGNLARLEVKTKPRNNFNRIKNKEFGLCINEWVMKESYETIKDDNLFYCFVTLLNDSWEAKFYIVPSKVVASYVKRQHELFIKNHPNSKPTAMRKFRLGFRGEKYPITTPFIEDYEDAWHLIK